MTFLFILIWENPVCQAKKGFFLCFFLLWICLFVWRAEFHISFSWKISSLFSCWWEENVHLTFRYLQFLLLHNSNFRPSILVDLNFHRIFGIKISVAVYLFLKFCTWNEANVCALFNILIKNMFDALFCLHRWIIILKKSYESNVNYDFYVCDTSMSIAF